MTCSHTPTVHVALNRGDLLELGDLVVAEMHGRVLWQRRIERVTKCYAICYVGEKVPVRFHRAYDTFGWFATPRPQYPQVCYAVFRTHKEV